MSNERSTRWTAWTALTTSALALGLSTWSLGCEREANAQSDGKTEAPAQPEQRSDAVAKNVGAPDPEPPKARTTAKAAPAKEPVGDPAQPPAEEPTASDVQLRVKRLVVTSAIEQREPVAVEALTADQKVVAFVELANAGADEGKVVITFERAGQAPVGNIELAVPGKQPRWRTWGNSRMVKTAGDWEVVVSTEDGQELARQKFVVVG